MFGAMNRAIAVNRLKPKSASADDAGQVAADSDLHDEIFEAQIEELTEATAKCRKAILVSR
jgi:hypothetical protein